MTQTTDPNIFKAYDVRGLYEAQITAEVAQRIGRAFVAYLGAGRIAVGRDMRTSAPEIAGAFIDGALRQGPTWSTTAWSEPTCSITASHATISKAGAMNHRVAQPQGVHRMKLVRRQALP